MKFYNYTFIVLITLGFTLAGCTQPRTDESATKENLATNRNNTAVEEPKNEPGTRRRRTEGNEPRKASRGHGLQIPDVRLLHDVGVAYEKSRFPGDLKAHG